MKVNVVDINKIKKDLTKFRRDHKQKILDEYYNLFFEKLGFKQLDAEQEYFIKRMFWNEGTVSCFKLLGSEGEAQHPQGILVFTPYNPSIINIYGFTIEAIPVNLRGVSFIPTRSMKVNEEIVLGWCQHNHRPIRKMVDYYANKIADIQMVMYINLQVQKTPWIIKATPENKENVKQLINSIFDDDPALAIPTSDMEDIDCLISGAPYIIDKLRQYECELINELDEFFGIGNLGVMEKKEHLVNEEVKSNNSKTRIKGECIKNEIQIWVDRVKEVLGVDMGFEFKESIDDNYYQDNPKEKEVEDDE